MSLYLAFDYAEHDLYVCCCVFNSLSIIQFDHAELGLCVLF
jgi:hypothetical protein